ncbi:MAG: class I SAM-dependent methyltransferase [Lachnospiraceae bacterium]|nr:class I SAM-dependent methyltransferase [Lachnospiraceae bacterium]
MRREETEAVRTHYNADPQKEWDRLQKKHPYEKYITTHMMDRYMKPGDTILDIGGGPGQYSVHYARQGHAVTLLDLSEENVRFAKKKARQYGVKITALPGNALDLSGFADGSFDAVFLMGPLYHLMEEESRLQALHEAARVLKPGGYLFSSFILMFGGVIYGLRELRESILWPEEQPLYDIAAREESLAFHAFTYAYMTTVRDAKKLLAAVPGLHTETVFGQEGILAPYRNVLSASPAKVRTAWYAYALRFCEKEEYLTHAEHLMIVSKKESFFSDTER